MSQQRAWQKAAEALMDSNSKKKRKHKDKTEVDLACMQQPAGKVQEQKDDDGTSGSDN